MILIHGKIIDDKEQNGIIQGLQKDLYNTLNNVPPLETETVINACDIFAKRVINGEFNNIILPLLEEFDISYEYFLSMSKLFMRDGLEYKCKIELTDANGRISENIYRKRYPLGILLHIAAGNIDGLPAYSVVEGLLAGNINILKIPAGDKGISIKLLYELIKIEPKLAEYIYVFDVPSTETKTLKQLADYSDAVVIWGGDAAVKAVRIMADIKTKIISWGHKLSFAYATTDASDEDLEGLAKHICMTNQVLCSSCQGIYLDIDSKEIQTKFAERFFEILKRVNQRSNAVDFGMKAQNAINIYTEHLEQNETGHIIFDGDGVSVICIYDKSLELSYMYRNVWIKRLPHSEIIDIIKPNKNHLQTVGILCPDHKQYAKIADIFARAGLVRITSGYNMSRMASGEAHDGLYPLREYSRIVETEIK